MSQAQNQPPATDAFAFERDGRNRPTTLDRIAVLREIHLSLIRAEENLYTLLEASPNEPSDHRNLSPTG